VKRCYSPLGAVGSRSTLRQFSERSREQQHRVFQERLTGRIALLAGCGPKYAKKLFAPADVVRAFRQQFGSQTWGHALCGMEEGAKKCFQIPQPSERTSGTDLFKTPYVGLRGHLISEVTSVYFAGVFPLLRLSYGPDQEKWWPIPDYRADQRQRSHPTTELKPNNHNARPASQCFQFIGSAEPGNNKRVESTTIAKPASPMRSIHRIIPTSTA
jgi:hypothetical protein